MAMTATVPRSRRTEALHLPNAQIASAHHRLLAANAKKKDPYGAAPPPPPPPPPRPNNRKRQLDASDRDFDPIAAKKVRFTTGIAVEIPARPSLHSRFPKDAPDAKPAPRQSPKPAVAAPANAPTSQGAPPAMGPRTAPAATQRQQQQQQQQQQQPQQQQRGRQRQSAPTKHQAKVANGLKHELDRLQPNAADINKDLKRKLRSQEATRFKSELSAYFPEYDEVIGNDPKETHLLNLDTAIIVTPDLSKSDSADAQPAETTAPRPITTYPIRSYSDALYTDLFNAQRIDFSFLNNKQQGSTHPPEADPLPDWLFTHPHKKAERLERSIRNTEKGRAQHEKDQIIRLLDGLQGPDWLRVMGVSGITESRKRAFEPAREHFIRGCEGILDKFRRWAAEEKRKRQELAERRAAALEEGDGESHSGDGDEGSERGGKRARGDSNNNSDYGADEGRGEDGSGPKGEPPDDSDVDASVAKQLREEALAAQAKKRHKAALKGWATKRAAKAAKAAAAAAAAAEAAASSSSGGAPGKKKAEDPPREITSFFARRYQRDAALSKTRRRNRTVLAWGQPVPDPPEADFELPAGVCDDETLKSHARRRRRDRRLKS